MPTCFALCASTNQLSLKSKHQTHELEMTLSVTKGWREAPHASSESHILKMKSCIRAQFVFDLLRARSARSTLRWILNLMHLLRTPARSRFKQKSIFVELMPSLLVFGFHSSHPTGVRSAQQPEPCHQNCFILCDDFSSNFFSYDFCINFHMVVFILARRALAITFTCARALSKFIVQVQIK